MKKLGTYTVRGSIGNGVDNLVDGTEKRIQLFDGRFDTAFKIIKFDIGPGDMDDPDLTARLTTVPNLYPGIVGFWNWGDNRQIAWASTNGSTDVISLDYNSFVDPDHLIVEDLYIAFRFASSDTKLCNYMITLEKYDITEWQGALTMVRNSGQGGDDERQ